MLKKEALNILYRPVLLLIVYFCVTGIAGYFLFPYSMETLFFTEGGGAIFQSILPAYMKESFLMFSLALTAFGIGFFVTLKRKSLPQAACDALCVDGFQWRSYLVLSSYTVLGALGIIYVFCKVGMVPLFSPNPIEDKFFFAVIDKFVIYRPIYMLALSLLTFSLTLWVFIYIAKFGNNYKFALVMIALASVVLAMTMRRFYFLFPFLSVIAVLFFNKTAKLRTLVIMMLCVMSISIGVEYIGKRSINKSVPTTSSHFEIVKSQDVLYRVSNNFFVEPGRFIRILILFRENKEHFLYGKSYLASILGFLPSSKSPMKAKFHLGRYLLSLMSLDPDMGGAPRIGYVGEAYLNFGYPGVIIISFLFGAIVRVIDTTFVATRNKRSLFAMLIIWLVGIKFIFGFFTSGSPEITFVAFNMILFVPFILLGNKCNENTSYKSSVQV